MADQLAKIEQDRAVMLAGISHDLRTPLARLRLETEMSVADEDARDHMAADIDQLDAIIDKFLDYARPDHADFKPVLLRDVIDACTYAVRGPRRHQDQPSTCRPTCGCMADEVELAARDLQPARERAPLRQDAGHRHRRASPSRRRRTTMRC